MKLKMSATFSIFLLFVSVISAQAQKDTWKEFVSNEGNFKIKFPIAPRKKESSALNDLGASKMVTFEVLLKETGFQIGFVDFPSSVVDQEELKVRYDNAVEGIKRRSGGKVTYQQDFYFEQFMGREVIYENANIYQVIRMILVNNRFYNLSVLTLASNNRTNAQKSNFEGQKNKFFNSFKFLEIPEYDQFTQKLPDYFQDTLTGWKYRNNLMGFSFNFPQNFTVLNKEQLDLIKEGVMFESEQDKTLQGDNLRLSLKRSEFLAGAVVFGETSILVAAELPPFAGMGLNGVALALQHHKRRDSSITITKDLYAFEIKGEKFYGIDFINKEGKLKQKMYLTLRAGISLQFIYSYKNDDELKYFDEFLKSVQFFEPVKADTARILGKYSDIIN